MKKHLISSAIAILGLASASAYALPPTATVQYTIYAGSGSAQPNAVYWAATQLLSNIDSYTDSATCAQSGTYRVLFGTAKAKIGTNANAIPAGANVLFIYRFAGGTFPNAIQAVANATGLNYPAPSAVAGASACASGSLPNPTYSFASGFATTSTVPDFGVSDEEPALFNNKTNVPGSYTVQSSGARTLVPGTPLTASQLSNISQTGIYENLMGLAVSNALYTGSHPKTSFSKSEIVGILTGTIQDWSQLYADDGTQLAAGPVVLLDRGPGSGTKAAMNQFFLQNPGAAGAGGSLTAYNEVTSVIGGGPTTSASSLAPVSACPSSFTQVNESSSTTLYQDLQALNNVSGGGCRAIGILGLEFPPETTGGGYQFVKIDGVDPYARASCNGTHVCATYANELNGSYALFYTNSFNQRIKSVNGATWSGDGSANTNFVNAFRTALQSSSLPGGVSGQFPAGVPGVLLDPSVTGAVAPCTTMGSHNLVSVTPLVPVLDASIIAGSGASITCNDQLQ